MRKTPTEGQLESRIKLVEAKVTGTYIARIDERRKTVRQYEIVVMLPEKWDLGFAKRLTAKALMESKEYPDVVAMRTYEVQGVPKKTDKTAKLKEMYDIHTLERYARINKQKASGVVPADADEMEDDGSLPPLVNHVG